MERLDADSLCRIFSFFNLKEKVRLESVCKRWKDVMMRHRVYMSEGGFDVGHYLMETCLSNYQQGNLVFEPTVLGILTRCGPFLKALGFGSSWIRITTPVIECIASHCTNITHLDLSAVILDSDLSPVLTSLGPRLEYLSFEDTSWKEKEDTYNIGKHFHCMKNLREIYLRNCGIEMTDILQLPESLQKVDLSSNWLLTPDILVSFLMNQRQLRYMALCPCPGGQFPKYSDADPSDGLAAVVECLSGIRTLEFLSLGQISHEPRVLSLHHLSNLVGLTELVFKQVNCLTGDDLQQILVETVNLKRLTVSHCAKVDNYMSLGACKSLEVLEVERTPQICDQDIGLVATHGKLQRVRLRRCYNVTCESVRILAQQCPITELDLTDTTSIHDRIFDLILSLPNPMNELYLAGCKDITRQGMVTLAKPNSALLESLTDVDFSRNKNLDNLAVIQLHSACLSTARSRPLRVYAFQSSVEPEMSRRVEPEIELIF